MCPIKAEGSYDPALIVTVSGYLNDFLDVNDSGKVHGSILVWDSGYGNPAGTWIVGTGGGAATGSLNSLSDVSVDGVSSGQYLIYLGSSLGWTGGTLPTSSAYFTGLLDVRALALTSGQGIIYDASIGKYVNTSIIYSPTGLLAGTGANNTTVIANATNLMRYCYLPSGEWYIGSKINVTSNYAKIFGPGTIKAVSNFSDTAILNLLGTGCCVEDIKVDGSLCDPAGASLGINLGGGLCKAINVVITGVPHHAILMNGDNTLVDGCRIYGRTGLSSAINSSSYTTTIRNTYISDFGRQGIGVDQPLLANRLSTALIDNCFIISNSGGNTSKVGILVDAGAGSSGFSHVDIRDTTIIFNATPTIQGNIIKMATAERVSIDNCNFYTTTTGQLFTCGLRIAEGVNYLKITNSYISPNILWEDNSLGGRFSETVIIDNCKIGNFTQPYHSGYVAISDIRARNFTLSNSNLKNSGAAQGIITDTGAFSRLSITNTTISGYRDGGTYTALFLSSGGVFHNTRSLYWNNNIVGYQGDNAAFTANTPTPRFLQTANYDGNRYATNINSADGGITGVVGFGQILFNIGDVVTHTGFCRTGEVQSWVATGGGVGTGNIWQPLTRFNDTANLKQSYFSGVYDVVLSGISNISLNTGIATQIQALVDSLPDDSTLRFPPGKYWLNRTIHFNHKRNLDVIAHGARFYETPDRRWMNSGTFYFQQCTGIAWHGGSLSGAANLNYVLSVASGVEMSGTNFENLATDSQLTRNVSPTTFNLEQCSDFLVDHFDIDAKYRYVFSHRCINTSFLNSTLVGVHTGWLNRLDESLVTVGTGLAQKGDIDKESARQSFMFNIIKGYDFRIHNIHAKQCGGLGSVGSISLGGGQGPAVPELIIIGDCSVRNAYDNGIYFSSVNKALVHHVQVICDTGLPHAIAGIKGRGNYIVFDHCYVEHTHHAYGIEAIGGSNDDYWTAFTKPGWSSQGSKITHCIAADVRTTAAFLDTNENTDTFPRDNIISDNYFYDCAKGPSGANPTGRLTGEDYMGTTVICANDARRVKIYNNIIENTGAIGPDVAIFLGENRLNVPYITGAEVYNNTILGAKQGIRIERMSHVRVFGNYGERIGAYNYAPFITNSGVAALISCREVKNSRFYDNTLIETGTAYCLYVVPGSGFVDNIVRDNDGVIKIN